MSSVKTELRHWPLPGILGLEQSRLKMSVLPRVWGTHCCCFCQAAFLPTSGLFFQELASPAAE